MASKAVGAVSACAATSQEVRVQGPLYRSHCYFVFFLVFDVCVLFLFLLFVFRVLFCLFCSFVLLLFCPATPDRLFFVLDFVLCCCFFVLCFLCFVCVFLARGVKAWVQP